MRWSTLAAIVTFVGVGACQDVVTVDEKSPPPEVGAIVSSTRVPVVDAESRAIMEAARQSLPPVSDSNGLVIGVLSRGRTPSSSFVVVENARTRDVYQFTLGSGGWIKGRRIAPRDWGATIGNPGGPLPSATDWYGLVGQIYDVNDNPIGGSGSPVPWEGYYAGYWHGNGAARRGKCYAGTQQYADGTTRLWCQIWVVNRNIYPTGGLTCSLADCRWFLRNTEDPNDTTKYGATDVELDFIIETPVRVTIAGPAQPITAAGTYTWTANPEGGDGRTYGYWLGYSLDNVSWSQVSSTRNYSRNLVAGDPSFYLKAIVWSLSNQKTVVQSVAVNITVPPLSVTISGPNTISTKGTYTWTATPSGGVGGYSYAWEVIQGGSRVGLGSQSTQSMTVYGGDPDFYMKVTVTSGGSTVADSVFVKNCIGLGGGCGA